MADKKYPTSKITFQGIGKLKGVDGYTAPLPVPGCTNPSASNYDPLANIDDGSCILPVYGCMIQTDPVTGVDNINYDPLANVNEVSATDPSNPCIPEVLGCTDITAGNYDASANTDDGSCDYNVYGCMDNTANNYDPLATVDDGSCTYTISGCTDDGNLLVANGDPYDSPYTGSQAVNYDATATVDDGSCVYGGCMDATALNYEPLAQVDDGSCQYTPVDGCTDPTACNYDPLATNDDGSCILPDGCTDAAALNYDSASVCDDGSCVFTLPSNNIPICSLTIDPHTGFNTSQITSGNYTGPVMLNNQSNQGLILQAITGSGSYPPTTYSIEIDFGTTAPADGTTTTIGPTTHTAYNGYYDILAENRWDGGTDGRMPTASGTITYTFVFNWENGNGGTVIHTETVTDTLDIVIGCIDADQAINYAGQLILDSSNNPLYTYQTQANPIANWQGIGCIPPVWGCTDPNAINYYQGANLDNGSCVYSGCTDPNATNYDPIATIDDGSCTYPNTEAFNPVSLSLMYWSNQGSGLNNQGLGLALQHSSGAIINNFQSNVYANTIALNLQATRSAHRQPASGGNANEPYSTTIEYSDGCGGTTPLVDLTSLTYIGTGWGDETTSGMNAYQPVNTNPNMTNMNGPSVSSQYIEAACNTSIVVGPAQTAGNTPAIFNNPSTFTEWQPGPFQGYQINTQGFNSVSAEETPGAGTSYIVAWLPPNSSLAINPSAHIYYEIKVETTDSIGDVEIKIYSWTLDTYGGIIFNAPFTPN
jgi:hypothetical protein